MQNNAWFTGIDYYKIITICYNMLNTYICYYNCILRLNILIVIKIKIKCENRKVTNNLVMENRFKMFYINI